MSEESEESQHRITTQQLASRGREIKDLGRQGRSRKGGHTKSTLELGNL